MNCWIRSPWFDGVWILSGLPIGLFLTFGERWIAPATMIFWIILLTQTGHTLSPIGLAWSHDSFRALMLRRPIKYIAGPSAILLVSVVAGAIGGWSLPDLHFDPDRFALASGPQSFADLKNPFLAMIALYGLWNAYHFGKQGFGVLSIYRRKIELIRPVHNNRVLGVSQRQIDKIYACAVIWAVLVISFIPSLAHELHNLIGWPAHPHPFLDRVRVAYLGAGLVLPAAMLVREWFGPRSLPRAIFILTDGLGLFLAFHFGLWGLAIVSINHWLAAIGIASHVFANHTGESPWPFALSIIVLGFVLFCVLFISPKGVWAHGLTKATLSFTAATVSFRLGLGYVHFLFDRWLYQFSRADVRATIGQDLFPMSPFRVIKPMLKEVG